MCVHSAIHLNGFLSAFRSDVAATRQYVLVYPSYQYITTRQDDPANSGFFETIQNYFINFGNGQTQGDESSQIMDAVDADKLQATTETKSFIVPAEQKPNPVQNEIKQKFFYSYGTPASTVPLSSDRRFYVLSEQAQVLSTYSGSALNPVLNLQPVPVVVSPTFSSRSNVAQSDDPQSGKVVSENVQKYSQIPPVMNTIVEPAAQVQVKNAVGAQTDSIVADAVSAILPTPPPIPASIRAIPVAQTDSIVADAESQNLPIPIPIPEAIPIVESKSAIVSDQSGSGGVTDTIVANSDAVPSPAAVSNVPSVVEARSNAIPLTVTNDSVSPIKASAIAAAELSNPSVVQPVVEIKVPEFHLGANGPPLLGVSDIFPLGYDNVQSSDADQLVTESALV